MIAPAIDADAFEFIKDSHTYQEGRCVRQSVTQIIKACGLVSYDQVPPAVLEEARRRGSHLHAMTEEHDRGGEIDPLWLSQKEWGYFEGYLAFLRDTSVRWLHIEHRMIAEVAGIRFGMTLDRMGLWRDGASTLGELKFTAAAHPCWGVQTAMYSMGASGGKRNRHRRMAVQFKPDGRYKIHDHGDPTDFEIAGVCMQMAHGIGNLERHAEVLATWKTNNAITA